MKHIFTATISTYSAVVLLQLISSFMSPLLENFCTRSRRKESRAEKKMKELYRMKHSMLGVSDLRGVESQLVCSNQIGLILSRTTY